MRRENKYIVIRLIRLSSFHLIDICRCFYANDFDASTIRVRHGWWLSAWSTASVCVCESMRRYSSLIYLPFIGLGLFLGCARPTERRHYSEFRERISSGFVANHKHIGFNQWRSFKWMFGRSAAMPSCPLFKYATRIRRVHSGNQSFYQMRWHRNFHLPINAWNVYRLNIPIFMVWRGSGELLLFLRDFSCWLFLIFHIKFHRIKFEFRILWSASTAACAFTWIHFVDGVVAVVEINLHTFIIILLRDGNGEMEELHVLIVMLRTKIRKFRAQEAHNERTRCAECATPYMGAMEGTWDGRVLSTCSWWNRCTCDATTAARGSGKNMKYQIIVFARRCVRHYPDSIGAHASPRFRCINLNLKATEPLPTPLFSFLAAFFSAFKLHSLVFLSSFFDTRDSQTMAARWWYTCVYLFRIESHYMFLLKAENCNFILFYFSRLLCLSFPLPLLSWVSHFISIFCARFRFFLCSANQCKRVCAPNAIVSSYWYLHPTTCVCAHWVRVYPAKTITDTRKYVGNDVDDGDERPTTQCHKLGQVIACIRFSIRQKGNGC